MTLKGDKCQIYQRTNISFSMILYDNDDDD